MHPDERRSESIAPYERRRRRLSTRLFGTYAMVMLITLSALAVGVLLVLQVARITRDAVEHSGVNIEAANQMGVRSGDLSAAVFDSAVSGQPIERTTIARAQRDFRIWLTLAREHAQLDGELALIQRIEKDFSDLSSVFEYNTRMSTPAAQDPVIPLHLERVRAGCVELAAMNLQAMRASTTKARARADRVAWLLALVASLTLLFGAWYSLHTARTLTRPLDDVIAAIERIALGEFSDPVPRSEIHEIDLVGQRFNAMGQALRRLRSLDVERLAREQQRIEMVLESIDDGLLILDATGKVHRVNAVALNQLGFTRNALLGHSLIEKLPRSQVGSAIELALLAPEREASTGEMAIHGPDAARLISYTLVPFHDGVAPGLVVVLRDITEQRAYENLRTQFVLRASHELRTPVTGMRMAYDLLAKRVDFPSGSREAELAATLQLELNRLGHLLDDLLDLSRLYAQSVKLQTEEMSGAELIAAAAQRFKLRCEQQGLRLVHDNVQVDLCIRADRVHLERVLDNLLNNALRHTPRGGQVTLSLIRRGPEAEFSVADSGEGIPTALHARIFEPFTQFSEKSGGAGLGLAMCREIVMHHGGQIGLRSTPGHGARFFFRLPLA